ncbi:toprim domain-containing protein [Xanthomonas sacchari]
MRATELAHLLGQQVEAVVRMLLPHGKRVGGEWKAGSVGGDAGESLGVVLRGDKAGVWSDFATGQSGDLIGLWMEARGCTLREACEQAMEHLGIREHQQLQAPPKRYSRPKKEGMKALPDPLRTWLTVERRIAQETLDAYKVVSRDGWIVFPYLRDGELIAVKYRRLPKEFRQEADCEPCLFGWQAIDPAAREVIIAEGELDALAWHTYGCPALSVPMGAGKGGKHTWVETEFDRLAVYDRINLSMDDDGPGREAVADLVERLGRERVHVVRLPRKDANACLIDGVSSETMLLALKQARTMDPVELRDIGEFEDEIWAEYGRQDHGLILPWRKTHDKIRLRPGETSIWGGINGHGKSTLASFVVGSLAAQDVRCCVASMEFRRGLWMMRMNRQVAGNPTPSERFSRHVTRALAGNVLAFDVQGSAKSRRILEVFRYARRRYGIELFLLDNLTKCGFDDDDYSGQKRFVEDLADFARDEQTHIAIVAHMKKGADENTPSGKMGVKGSGGITDMVDTVLEVWRNKPLEEAKRKAEATNTELDEKWRMQSDVLLCCYKQRATGWEGRIALWYDVPTTHYLQNPTHRPRPLLPASKQAMDGQAQPAASDDDWAESFGADRVAA